ncbi:plasmid maintenance system killer protein [Eilatimonas milleporae]|uniref:Plasmid maintenance system killer protein n=1 Tax=Eilatimonas milleporae TaxID=911205 RepID=A0A3M0CX06_9PROT|nr:plasmid maintenance system killer protein [Eilatimonas milleporae]
MAAVFRWRAARAAIACGPWLFPPRVCKAPVDRLIVRHYLTAVIRTIRHKGLSRYWQSGRTRGLDARFLPRLERMLSALDAAKTPDAMNIPGWYFHALHGRMAGRYSVRVSGNWRLTFAFDDGDAVDVNLEDYH